MTSSSPALHLEDTEHQYQRALNFLVTNEPEQCLEVQLSLQKYKELERYADNLYGEKKYPYVDYDTNTSTLHCPCSAAWHGAEMALIQHNKPETARRQAYGKSSYTFRREYEKLQNDAYLWLNGAYCQMAFIICLQEQPKFKDPSKAAHTITLEAYDVFNITMADTLAENTFGPYIYNSHTWFGPLAEAFAVMCSSIQQRLVQNGTFLVQGEELDTGITLGDVLPSDEMAAADVRAVAIKFVTEDIRALLIAGARTTVSNRFRALVAE
ncbi:hypothetical protein V1515DRAFT_614756 [Lipomyces mesembrius]